MKARFFLASALFVGVLGIAFYLKEHPNVRKTIYSPGKIRVRIGGFVAKPGFYSMEEGQRGKDLIEASGGILPEWKERAEALDLDQLLYDGQVLELGKK